MTNTISCPGATMTISEAPINKYQATSTTGAFAFEGHRMQWRMVAEGTAAQPFQQECSGHNQNRMDWQPIPLTVSGTSRTSASKPHQNGQAR